MRVTGLTAHRLRVPLPKPRSLPPAEDPALAPPDAISLIVVELRTDAASGLGFSVVPGSGRAALAIIEDDLRPLVIGADPRLTERIHAQAKRQFPEISRGGVGACAFAAIDVALWDAKAKSANMPLWCLLGGCRDSAPVHFAETAAPGLSADQVVELAKPILAQNVRGLRVGVGTGDTIADAQKLQHVRDELGEDVWFGVSANQSLDANTALAFGRFLEQELDADWFEDPTSAADVEAYARLAQVLELPIAAGSSLGAEAFAPLVAHSGVGVLRPDVARAGGLTAVAEIISLASAFHRQVVPHLGPLIGIHLACALPNVTAVEYVRWLEPVFTGGPTLREDGRLAAPTAPGLGFDLRDGAVAKFRL